MTVLISLAQRFYVFFFCIAVLMLGCSEKNPGREISVDSVNDTWDHIDSASGDVNGDTSTHSDAHSGNGSDTNSTDNNDSCGGTDTDTTADCDTGADSDAADDTGSDTDDDTDSDTDRSTDTVSDKTDTADSDSTTATTVDTDDDTNSVADSDTNSETDSSDTDSDTPMIAELWYSVRNLLVNVQLDPTDGSIVGTTSSPMEGLLIGSNSITMLADGALFGSRLSSDALENELYYVPAPRADGAPVDVVSLGPMIDDIKIEALYTDCDGRLFAMDTGVDVGSSVGNRLIVFSGDYLNGDLSYQVVSDWSKGDVADIDDLGPGINDAGEITDANGFAIDTGSIYAFNYEEGNGTKVGEGGDWAIHALGRSLFEDNQARLYVMTRDAIISQVDHVTFEEVGDSFTGPTPEQGSPGWTGLAGPLTDCITEFTIVLE